MQVKIPFMERFREPMLSGVKTMTSRTRRMAYAGDTFEAFGTRFEIQSVSRERYEYILDFWHAEGCSSREDLVAVWREIHPCKQFKPDELLWVHRFMRIDEANRCSQ